MGGLASIEVLLSFFQSSSASFPLKFLCSGLDFQYFGNKKGIRLFYVFYFSFLLTFTPPFLPAPLFPPSPPPPVPSLQQPTCITFITPLIFLLPLSLTFEAAFTLIITKMGDSIIIMFTGRMLVKSIYDLIARVSSSSSSSSYSSSSSPSSSIWKIFWFILLSVQEENSCSPENFANFCVTHGHSLSIDGLLTIVCDALTTRYHLSSALRPFLSKSDSLPLLELFLFWYFAGMNRREPSFDPSYYLYLLWSPFLRVLRD